MLSLKKPVKYKRITSDTIRDVVLSWHTTSKKKCNTENVPIGWTISISDKSTCPKVKLDGKRFLTKCRWSNMKSTEQYNWLIRYYIPRVVSPFVKEGVIVFEFNHSKNLHAHLCCLIDVEYNKDAYLKDIQINVSRTTLVMQLIKRSSHAKYLNCIHYLKKDDWHEYLIKDVHKNESQFCPLYFKRT